MRDPLRDPAPPREPMVTLEPDGPRQGWDIQYRIEVQRVRVFGWVGWRADISPGYGQRRYGRTEAEARARAEALCDAMAAADAEGAGSRALSAAACASR